MFDYAYIDDWQVPGLRSLTGLGSPAPRQDVTDRAARHGAIDRTLFYSGRVLDLQGIIWAADAADAWSTFDALKGKLALGTEHVLKFRRTGFLADEQLSVIVASAVDDGTSYDAGVTIQYGVSLHAADPRIYSAALRAQSYDPAAAAEGSGALMPLAFPLVFTGDDTGEFQVPNGGNFKTPPVLTINGPVVNPILDNVTTGESISIVYALGASDVVEVDVAARTVTLNGALRPDLLEPTLTEWWELAPGTNLIRLRGTGMAVYVEGTTNLVTNGGFETDLTGWTMNFANWSSTTLERSTTWSMFGSASLHAKGTKDNSSTNRSLAAVFGGSTHIPVVEGLPYSFSAYVKTADPSVPTGAGTGAGYVAYIQWYTPSGTNGISAVEATVDEGANGLRLTVENAVAPPGTTGAALVVRSDSTSPLDVVEFYIDGVQLEQNDHVTDYVDTNGAAASREEQTPTQLTVAYRDARI